MKTHLRSPSSVVAALVAALATLSTLDPQPARAQTPDSFNPGANSPVYALAVQADGKILVGGLFTTLAGQTRNRIGRLNANGTLDTGFNPGAGGEVDSLAVQADGRILVGGRFVTLAGQARNYIGRLNADGTLDTGFNPGAGGEVYSLAVQADGKILVGGHFGTLDGQTRSSIGRLNADGIPDSGFNPGASGDVLALAIQPDGGILAGGYFTTLAGQTRNLIGRLNGNGTLDTGFNPGAGLLWDVGSLAVQADGKILVGGNFSTLAGQTRNYIGRLNADGTLDTGFNPGANSTVWSLAVQANGKILVAGQFTALAGQTCNYIGRLNVDGTLDTGFSPGAGYYVYSLAVQADGKILLSGDFTTLGGQTRNHVGRLNNTEPATQGLSLDGSTITWLRGGASPEVWRTTFDFSTNGTDWTSLGVGTRIAGGWQVNSVSPLSTNDTIRARGYAAGGCQNASSWFVESDLPVGPPPVITTQPSGQTVAPGSSATFTVAATGTPPLSYQWLFKGGAIAGATTNSYTINNVQLENSGIYSVVVRDIFGSVLSDSAMLTVEVVHAATATATVANGFAIGVTIDDGGWGYTNTPSARIIGGGGSGAQAVAVVSSNGVVIAVNLLNAGIGYTSTPVIVIAPPFIDRPVMGIAPLSLLTFTNLAVGTSYQLQFFSGLAWSDIGAAFAAASSTFTQYVSGTAGPNGYRLTTIPAPEQAYATAQALNGFVIAVTVTSGGAGYTTNPAVSIIGGGGSNATATATVSGGVVTAIDITSAGIGYTNAPDIVIAPPPANALWPTVNHLMELDMGRLSPYDNYQLEFTPVAGGAWSDLGVPFTPTSSTNTQYVDASGNAGFFRVRYVPPP